MNTVSRWVMSLGAVALAATVLAGCILVEDDCWDDCEGCGGCDESDCSCDEWGDCWCTTGCGGPAAPGPSVCQDADCPEGWSCNSEGACAPSSGPGSSGPGSPGPHAGSPPPGCTGDADCGAGEVCRDGACVADGGPECVQNCDCEEGFLCVDGSCVEAPEEEPGDPPRACQTRCECTSGEDCIGGFCVTPVPCNKPGDCEGGLSCVDGTCREVQKAEQPRTCVFNHECGAQGYCLDGLCHEACGDRLECPSGEVCLGGTVCVEDPNAPAECVYTAECQAEGALCVDGTCAVTCRADPDCGEGRVCVGGFCEEARAASPQCRRNVDCGSDRVCVDAVCRVRCECDADCGDGGVCDGGFCKTAVEVSPQCRRDTDCGVGLRCLGAACVAL